MPPPRMLRPLKTLTLASAEGKTIFPCVTGRLKWCADTRALSIKVALESHLPSSLSGEITLEAASEHESLRFLLAKDFTATVAHATLSLTSPRCRYHYLVQGHADLCTPPGNTP